MVWGVCRSDHSRNHSRDDERALGWSQHGEAFEGEEGMMAAVERGLIYAVGKMSRDLLWGLWMLNLELKERVVGYQEGDDQMEA